MSRILIATTRPIFGVSGRDTGSALADRVVSSPFALLAVWGERLKQRAALAEMDDRMLKDIGLSRADALAEALEPYWTA